MGLPQWSADYAATVQAIAAIMQTVAAILALTVAVGVPWWQRRGELQRLADERRAEAIAFICVVTPDLIELDRTLADLAEWMPARAGFLHWNGIMPGKGSTTTDITPSLQHPPALVSRLDKLHVLGGLAAVCVMRLFAAINDFNAAGHTPEARIAALPEVRARLDRLNTTLEDIWPGPRASSRPNRARPSGTAATPADAALQRPTRMVVVFSDSPSYIIKDPSRTEWLP